MIYEVRTYTLKPRTVAEFEKRFAEAYEQRKLLSPIAAFWHTEVGLLNQVIHVWPYKDLAERDRIRAEAVKSGNWPPKNSELIVRMQSEIFHPFAISPPMTPGKVGPIFEMRTYTYEPGQLPVIVKCWEAALPVRLRFGPVAAVWYSELGALNKFVHIWPYRSMEQREEIRGQAAATGEWPPYVKAAKEGFASYLLTEQENKIMLPASFSPLQ